MMVMLFLLFSHITKTVLTVQLEVWWYKSYSQKNFVLFGPPPFPPSLSFTPDPSPSCLFYSEIKPETIGLRILDPMERQLTDQLSNHLLAVGAVTRVCYCKSASSAWHQ